MASDNHSLFISDLHLSAERADICAAFTRFCEQRAVQAQALYLLGDISDAWVGDDDDGPIATLLREQLHKLVAAGIGVYLMVGNRDFLFGERFAHDTGCVLLEDPMVIDLYGEATLLLHGDSLCTGDTEYMTFREQIRDPGLQAMLLEKSLQERRDIAAMLRSQSKSANATKAEDIMDVSPEAVDAIFAEYGVRQMIHGHTHRPAVHELGDGRQRYVLGDWDERGWMITASASGLALTDFAMDCDW